MNTQQALLIATLALSGSFAIADEQGNIADRARVAMSRACWVFMVVSLGDC